LAEQLQLFLFNFIQSIRAINQKKDSFNNPTLFDGSNLNKGVYFFEINSENTKTTKQIAKF